LAFEAAQMMWMGKWKSGRQVFMQATLRQTRICPRARRQLWIGLRQAWGPLPCIRCNFLSFTKKPCWLKSL